MRLLRKKNSMNFAGIKDDIIAMLAGESISVDVKKYDNTKKGF